jgi:hypothetical protein
MPEVKRPLDKVRLGIDGMIILKCFLRKEGVML